MKSPPELENIIATHELERRPQRRSDPDEETKALLALTEALARSPGDFFQQLAKAALRLSGAGSTGISLLNEEEGRFVWPAVDGQLRSYLGSGTPSDFGPCGTVLDRGTALLLIRPQRYFTYLDAVSPCPEEVLLIPFRTAGKIVGTIWAVSHDPDHRFSPGDRQILESLSAFASSAYSVPANTGALLPLLEMRPGHGL